MAEGVRFTITPKGITFEADGFTGGKCLTELASFQEAMERIGITGKNENREIKPEMYATEDTVVTY